MTEDQDQRVRRIAKRAAVAKKLYGKDTLTYQQLKCRLLLEQKKLDRLREKK